MQRANRMPARSPRRTPQARQQPNGSYRLQFPAAQRGIYARATPPHSHLQFAPRPSPQDEMMTDVQGLPIV